MTNEPNNRELKCLVHSFQFEIFWNYYQQCDGQAFASECHNAAVEFFEDVDTTPGLISLLNDSAPAPNTVPLLRKWTNSANKCPLLDKSMDCLLIRTFFIRFNKDLISKLGLGSAYSIPLSAVDKLNDYLKWRGHLPSLKAGLNIDTAMKRACQSETIVVIGDIRHSQELMEHAIDPEYFSIRMVNFLQDTRSILFSHGAIFDKFTGDGFVAYFNESIRGENDLDWIDCFVGFLREHRKFCAGHFQEWKMTLTLLPPGPIGIGIGVDLGSVSFQHHEHHFVAIGAPIVWANRMATEAKAGEIIANNRLYERLKHRKDLEFSSRNARTKSGEDFVATLVSLVEPLVKP